MSVIWSKTGYKQFIYPTKVAYPTCDAEFVYTGNIITPVWKNYNSEVMTIGGTINAVEEGLYTTIFTLNDGYVWEDGSKTPYMVTWSIVIVTDVELLWNEDITIDGYNNFTLEIDEYGNAAHALGFNKVLYEESETSTKKKYRFDGLVIAHKDNLEVTVECEFSNSSPDNMELWCVKNFLYITTTSEDGTLNRSFDEYEKLEQFVNSGDIVTVVLNKGDVLDVAQYSLNKSAVATTITKIKINYKM